MSTIRMLQGDCMEFMAGLGENAFDLAVVDIPYGLRDKLTTGGTWASKYKTGDACWDKIPEDSYFNKLFQISNNQIIWGGNYVKLPPNRCYLIWDKIALMPTMADSEYAWTSFDKNAKTFRHTRNTREKRIHITQKPVPLYKWILKNYAKETDTILDTHGGSGSICIACIDMGFDLTWIEKDPDYYAAAVERVQRHNAQLDLFREQAEIITGEVEV